MKKLFVTVCLLLAAATSLFIIMCIYELKRENQISSSIIQPIGYPRGHVFFSFGENEILAIRLNAGAFLTNSAVNAQFTVIEWNAYATPQVVGVWIDCENVLRHNATKNFFYEVISPTNFDGNFTFSINDIFNIKQGRLYHFGECEIIGVVLLIDGTTIDFCVPFIVSIDH